MRTGIQTLADNVELAARRALDDRAAARVAIEWYPRTLAYAQEQARAYGFTVEQVAGALAALSPLQSWAGQLEFTPRILEFARNNPEGLAPDVPGPGFHTNKRKALAILRGAAPLSILGGLKVRAFYAAILGDTSSVVVDRHATSVAYAGNVPPTLTDKRYRDVAKAYALAAVAVGLAPAQVQALTWEWWRVNHSHYGTGA